MLSILLVCKELQKFRAKKFAHFKSYALHFLLSFCLLIVFIFLELKHYSFAHYLISPIAGSIYLLFFKFFKQKLNFKTIVLVIIFCIFFVDCLVPGILTGVIIANFLSLLGDIPLVITIFLIEVLLEKELKYIEESLNF